jgi:hypothetical protein
MLQAGLRGVDVSSWKDEDFEVNVTAEGDQVSGTEIVSSVPDDLYLDVDVSTWSSADFDN